MKRPEMGQLRLFLVVGLRVGRSTSGISSGRAVHGGQDDKSGCRTHLFQEIINVRPFVYVIHRTPSVQYHLDCMTLSPFPSPTQQSSA